MLTHIEYAGYTLRPKDASDEGGEWLISKKGAQAMPGAATGLTKADAFMAADVLEVVGGDGGKFWHLWRAIRGHREREREDSQRFADRASGVTRKL